MRCRCWLRMSCSAGPPGGSLKAISSACDTRRCSSGSRGQGEAGCSSRERQGGAAGGGKVGQLEREGREGLRVVAHAATTASLQQLHTNQYARHVELHALDAHILLHTRAHIHRAHTAQFTRSTYKGTRPACPLQLTFFTAHMHMHTHTHKHSP